MDDNHQTKALSLIAAYQFGKEHGLDAEVAEIRNMAIDGFRNKGAVRRGYIIHLFTERGIFDDFRDRHWHFGLTPEGRRKHAMYLRQHERHRAMLGGIIDEEAELESEDEDQGEQAFALESDLRDYLAHNLSVIEPGLRLFERDGRNGIEYPIEGGQIDVLALDRNDTPVVIELKLSRGRNRTIGQVLYYMGWIDKHLGQGQCRGLIIARDVTDDLMLATARATGISLFRYKISMSLELVSSNEPREA
ncbi:MAG: endonuclease NucS domain-containing protein [Gammaproteobacteria bacterium]